MASRSPAKTLIARGFDKIIPRACMGGCSRVVRFGVFEADLESGDSRKHGLRIRLPQQGFQVLAVLLERPGSVVTRIELQERLWPGRTYVDFEHGLNKAVNRLRAALGDTASNPRFVETVSRRGYRLLVPVNCEPSLEIAAPHRKRLAVLPFENLSAEAGEEFFSDGLTEEMISELGRLCPSRLGIIARTSAMQYKHGCKRVDEIGKELNVDYILEGSVRRMQNRVRITIQLVHVADQTHLWAQSYDRELADLFQVQREVAQRVADSLAFELLPEPQSRGKLVIPEAHEAYLRGRYFWNRGSDADARSAISCYQHALEGDPEFALAYSGIADCYSRLVWFAVSTPLDGGAKAKAAAIRALELDESLAEAHAAMAVVRFRVELGWVGAGREVCPAN